MDAVESMMWLHETPWHHKGIEITESAAYDIDSCIKSAGLDWPVTTKQCYIEVMNGLKAVDAYATVRTTDNSILGVVGERYEVLQNIEAFKIFQPFLDQKVARLNTAGSLFEGKKIWILAEILSDPIFIRDNDQVRKFILLSHGHDGKSIVRFGLTPQRVVCANTLAMAHESNLSNLFKARHTKNLQNNLEQIREMIRTINNDYDITIANYKILAQTSFSKDDIDKYVKTVLNIDEEKLSTRSYNIIERVKSYFTHAPGAQGETLWDAFNAVTYYLSHDYGNNVENRLSNLWFGKSVETSKYALQVAMEMI